MSGTRIERALFAVFVTLFAWTLFERLALGRAGTHENAFVVLTAAMVLMTAAPLVRRQAVRYGLMALSAMALIGFFVARY
jgi:hypothetical protein